MWKALRLHLRLVAGAVGSLMALGGGIGAVMSYSDYLPATRLYARSVAKDETDSALNVATARMGNLQRESTETRLQINQVRRDTLRADKFNREQQLQLTSDPTMRQLLQQRLDEIADALQDVNAERDRLRSSPP